MAARFILLKSFFSFAIVFCLVFSQLLIADGNYSLSVGLNPVLESNEVGTQKTDPAPFLELGRDSAFLKISKIDFKYGLETKNLNALRVILGVRHKTEPTAKKWVGTLSYGLLFDLKKINKDVYKQEAITNPRAAFVFAIGLEREIYKGFTVGSDIMSLQAALPIAVNYSSYINQSPRLKWFNFYTRYSF